jgi:type IV secretion system protein VirD4
VKLLAVWQDLPQAKDIYRDRWESFIANAGVLQAFAPQDMTTAEFLSARAMQRTEDAPHTLDPELETSLIGLFLNVRAKETTE